MDFGFIFVHNLRARLPVNQLLCKVSQHIFKIEKKNNKKSSRLFRWTNRKLDGEIDKN